MAIFVFLLRQLQYVKTYCRAAHKAERPKTHMEVIIQLCCGPESQSGWDDTRSLNPWPSALPSFLFL